MPRWPRPRRWSCRVGLHPRSSGRALRAEDDDDLSLDSRDRGRGCCAWASTRPDVPGRLSGVDAAIVTAQRQPRIRRCSARTRCARDSSCDDGGPRRGWLFTSSFWAPGLTSRRSVRLCWVYTSWIVAPGAPALWHGRMAFLVFSVFFWSMSAHPRKGGRGHLFFGRWAHARGPPVFFFWLGGPQGPCGATTSAPRASRPTTTKRVMVWTPRRPRSSLGVRPRTSPTTRGARPVL